MLRFFKASEKDLKQFIDIRLEMLKEVNSLNEDHIFSDEFLKITENYLKSGDQTTLLVEAEGIIGCATICYYNVLPTYSHPTGKRAHIMNVYTKKEFRGQGIGRTLLELLIEEAKNRDVTLITLDATEQGKKLYKGLGFYETDEGMILDIPRLLQDKLDHTGIYANGGPHCCGCGNR